jgi:hypothetical protein
MKLAVVTPAHGEAVSVSCLQSLLRLQRLLMRRRDQMLQVTISHPERSEARNFLLSYWFDKTDASHILFADPEIGFDPQLVVDMIAFDKPVTGVVYAQPHVDLVRLAQGAAKGESPPRAIARAHDYVFRPLKGRPPRLVQGFLQVEACGAGLLLVSRDCIKQMLAKEPGLSDRAAKKYLSLARDLDRLIRAFDPLTVDGIRLADGFAFCHRWRTQCDGEIWACTNRTATQTGAQRFEARLADAAGGTSAITSIGPEGAAASGNAVRSRGAPVRLKGKAPRKRARIVKTRLAQPKANPGKLN